jgi:hypothetical protein
MKGILLNDNDDLMIANGSLAVGDITIQSACLVLRMNQGELKEDPVIGVNLSRFIRGKENRAGIKRAIEIGLRRAGIEIEDVKNEIWAVVNKQKVNI